MEFEETILNIITYSGEARNQAMAAIVKAKAAQFDKAADKISEAEELLVKAHKKQTELIQMEAAGTRIEPSLLLNHAQDHLMNAMLFKDMALEFIALYSKISKY